MAVNSKQKGEVFVCEQCGKQFFVPKYKINSRPTIKYCSTDCYHDASRKPTMLRECLQCGNEFVISPKHKDKKFCNVECACAYRREQKRVATIGTNGYKYVWFADGSGEKEHRYLMEQHLGRKLKKDEVVHHIDGNRTNNDLGNLVVMSRGEHSALHRKMELSAGKKLFGGESYAD